MLLLPSGLNGMKYLSPLLVRQAEAELKGVYPVKSKKDLVSSFQIRRTSMVRVCSPGKPRVRRRDLTFPVKTLGHPLSALNFLSSSTAAEMIS